MNNLKKKYDIKLKIKKTLLYLIKIASVILGSMLIFHFKTALFSSITRSAKTSIHSMAYYVIKQTNLDAEIFCKNIIFLLKFVLLSFLLVFFLFPVLYLTFIVISWKSDFKKKETIESNKFTLNGMKQCFFKFVSYLDINFDKRFSKIKNLFIISKKIFKNIFILESFFTLSYSYFFFKQCYYINLHSNSINSDFPDFIDFLRKLIDFDFLFRNIKFINLDKLQESLDLCETILSIPKNNINNNNILKLWKHILIYIVRTTIFCFIIIFFCFILIILKRWISFKIFHKKYIPNNYNQFTQNDNKWIDDSSLNLINNSKIKGNIFEDKLETFLLRFIPTNILVRNFKLSNNKIVDFGIKINFKDNKTIILPLDSKAHTLVFEKYKTAKLSDKTRLKQNMLSMIEKSAASISKKYISSNETTSVAVLFLPNKKLFFELYNTANFLNKIFIKYKVVITSSHNVYYMIDILTELFNYMTTEEIYNKIKIFKYQSNITNIDNILNAIKNNVGKIQNIIK